MGTDRKSTRFMGDYRQFCAMPVNDRFDTSGRGPYHARAMGNPLRDRRTAVDLASDEQVVEIAEKISSFRNLTEIVEADLAALGAGKVAGEWRDREVRGELQFGFAALDRSIPIVSGSASVDVDAVCQRCLEPFRLGLSIEPRLLLVKGQEAVQEFDDFEVWELEESTLRVQDIVEELLIMALPLSARHDTMAECKAFATDDGNAPKMKRPFAALGSQMQQFEKDPD